MKNKLEEIYAILIIDPEYFEMFEKFKIKNESEIKVDEIPYAVEFENFIPNEKIKSVRDLLKDEYKNSKDTENIRINDFFKSYYFYNFNPNEMDEKYNNDDVNIEEFLSEEYACTQMTVLVSNNTYYDIVNIGRYLNTYLFFKNEFGEKFSKKILESGIYTESEIEYIEDLLSRKKSFFKYLEKPNIGLNKWKRIIFSYGKNLKVRSLLSYENSSDLTDKDMSVLESIFQNILNVKNSNEYKENKFSYFMNGYVNLFLKFEKLETITL